MAALYAVDDLVAELRALDGDLAPARVAAMLRDLSVDERTLAPYLTWSAGKYTRNLIVRDVAFELMALCWDRDATTAIHNHTGSDCAFVLLRGAVTCENFRITAPTAAADRMGIERTGTRTLQPGHIDLASGERSVHRVAVADGPVVTLHVYAKPLDTYTHFDERGRAQPATSRYDSVPPKG